MRARDVRRAATTRRWRGGESLSASTVMQNASWRIVRVDPAQRHEVVVATGRSASRSGPRCSSIRSAEKRSWPAGDRRVRGEDGLRGDAPRAPRRTSMPSSSIRWRISSSAAKALCPSFRCRTPGEMPSARQRPHAADAQQQLLADADAVVAAVEPGGQLAVFRRCSRRRRSRAGAAWSRPTCDLPDPGADVARSRLDRDRQRLAVRASIAGSNRQGSAVQVQVVLLLPAVRRRDAAGSSPGRRTARRRPAGCPGPRRS